MRIKKAALAATVLVAATTASVLVPASSALATNQVTCKKGAGFVRIEGHKVGDHAIKQGCIANAGDPMAISEHDRITKIRTGNNDIYWYGANGKRHFLGRHDHDEWGHGGIEMTKIKILSCDDPKAQC
ncbi:hypothetical protein ACIBL8_46970 [Streptomyces sp. NPDC050523]|uniref:hypothetical protein n=1 Tax=Streptomyces sp. NPDC050523 TaxID=3365622 RepID=UPI00379E7AEA